MIDTREQIKQRLLVLVGLNVSGVGHAAEDEAPNYKTCRRMVTTYSMRLDNRTRSDSPGSLS